MERVRHYLREGGRLKRSYGRSRRGRVERLRPGTIGYKYSSHATEHYNSRRGATRKGSGLHVRRQAYETGQARGEEALVVKGHDDDPAVHTEGQLRY